MTNGQTNGRWASAVNGLKWGFTNGSSNGRTNGLTNGLVNGSGAVNGFRLSYHQRRVRTQEVGLKKKLVAVAILAAIWIVIPYAAVYAFPKEKIEIDGYFMDWLKVQMYRDTPDAPNPDVSIQEYAMKRDSDGTYFYLATDGQMLYGRDQGADGFFIFIDRDCNAETGYSVRGLGADAMIEIIGWNTTLKQTLTYVFMPASDPTNFGGFHIASAPHVAASGNKMELSTSVTTCPESRVAILARHTNSTDDWSEVNFRATGSAIRVVENHDAEPVIGSTGVQHLLTLNITGKGPKASIEGLVFDYLGNVTPGIVSVVHEGRVLGSSNSGKVAFYSPLEVDDDLVSLDVQVEFLSDATTGSIGLLLNRSEGVAASRNISWSIDYAQSGAKVSYIGFAPGRIAIDGAFADWDLRAPLEDLRWDAYSPVSLDNRTGDVDIDTVKVASTTSVASFYVSVNGTMLGGSSVPNELVRFAPFPPASNISDIILPVYGSDFAFVFVDRDGDSNTGFSVGGSEVAIAVAGKGNAVQSSTVFEYVGGTWVMNGTADAAIDRYQLEVSSSYEALGLTPGRTYGITFVAEDWSGREDSISVPLPARISAGTRSYPGILINEIFTKGSDKKPNDWLELYNTGMEPIPLAGYQLWIGGLLVYTFPDVTLASGQFFVTPNLNFRGGQTIVLVNGLGETVDQVARPVSQGAYGRVGSAPYNEWANMRPTPGAINLGQVPIPEFGDVVVALAIVPIMIIAIRRAKRLRSRSAD